MYYYFHGNKNVCARGEIRRSRAVVVEIVACGCFESKKKHLGFRVPFDSLSNLFFSKKKSGAPQFVI